MTGVQIHLAVRISMAELTTWEPAKAEALLRGIALIASAAGGKAR